MIVFNSEGGGSAMEFIANQSYRIAESVDNGVNLSFFKEFLTKFAKAQNIG